MNLTSTAFIDNGPIPSKYTCEGDNINPPLVWDELPAGTKSLALIMDDPDVPRNLRPDGLFVHWLVWNIPPAVTSIAENSQPVGVIGMTTARSIGYAGPCPPDRMHRYYFRLYALDVALTIPSTVSKRELLQAMEGHILDHAQLMGRYEKKNVN